MEKPSCSTKETVESVKFMASAYKEAFDEGGFAWDDASNNRAFLSNTCSSTSNGASIYLLARSKPETYLTEKGTPLKDDTFHTPLPKGTAGQFSYISGRRIDDAQYLGGSGLAVEPLACLGQQPSIFHGDDCLRGKVLQQCDLLVGEWENFFSMHYDRPEQRCVFSQRHHDPRADPARVDKLSIGLVCAVDLCLGSVGQADDVLTACDPAERSVGEQRGRTFLSHRLDKSRISAQRHGMRVLALDPPNVSVSRLAEAQRLFQDGVEDRGEIAG
jgi:hypothetical protein